MTRHEKTIVRVTNNKREAQNEAKRINASFKMRGIKRKAYVGIVSRSYVKTRTREGYPIPKRNYAIYIRDKR